MPRGTGSVWTMLLWKEWRQQWLAFALLAATCLGAYAIWCKPDNWRGDGTTLTAMLVFAALCLGVNAFATDTDDRSGEFLDQLPVSAWRLLLTRYLMVMALASLCLVLPVALMTPAPGDWGLYTWGALVWGPAWSVPVAFVIASGAVALTGALTRSGLGGMGTWLLAAGLVGVTASAPIVPALVTGRRFPFLLGIILAWGVDHCWLLRVWWVHRPEQVRAWRVGFWVALALLIPVASGMPAIAHRWLFASLRQAASAPDTSVSASASPDGRTVAVTAEHRSTKAFPHAETWLLDVDAGRTRRIGPRWRNGDGAGWSPNGRELSLHTTRSFLPREHYGKHRSANIEERVYDLTGGGCRLMHRRTDAGNSGAGWLGDGTYAIWTPAAYEFVNLDTGETQRCLHPLGDGFVEKVLTGSAWLHSAIVTAQCYEDKSGKSWLQVWRSAPGLERTERRYLPADPVIVKAAVYAWQVSPDGRWLLLVPSLDQPEAPFGILSLDDGSGHLLSASPASHLDRPFFTPDGSLLIAQLTDGLQIWDLTSGRPKPEGKIPLPHPSWHPAELSRAISPKPPWRVAVTFAEYTGTYVVDLAERRTTEVLSLPFPEGYSNWQRKVSWLGNDRLLVEYEWDYQLWVVNANGSGSRQVLP